MVDGETHHEAVLVEERHEVGGIGQARHGKAGGVKSFGSYGLLVLTKVALAWKPKPVSQNMCCTANSTPRTSADGPLTCEVTVNCASEPSGSVAPLIGLVSRAADDEVGHVLHEDIDRDVGVLA